MTKTKRQLRAEAVGRLKQLGEYNDGEDIVKAMVPEGVTVNRTNWTVELDTIIDLLTDDCDTECYACSKLAELRAENNALRGKCDEWKAKAEEEKLNADGHWRNANNIAKERDEWKAKAEGSSKVRVGSSISNLEWLYRSTAYDGDAFHNMVIGLARPYYLEAHPGLDERRIITWRVGEWLLSPHEDEGGESCRQDADQRERAESADCESDTRGKLEADMKERLGELWANAWDAGSRDSMDDDFDIDVFSSLLDRQAAITDREWIDTECAKCGARENERDRDFTELQAKVDELTAQLEAAYAKNRSLKAHIAKMQEGRHGWHVKGEKLQREVDRLTRENISLARDLGECMAERDGLKRENAKLSDDEFYLRCTLVDMDGEAVG